MKTKKTMQETLDTTRDNEMSRIRRYKHVNHVNLSHIDRLPNFGLFHLNLEQIIPLIVADLAMAVGDGLELLDENNRAQDLPLQEQALIIDKMYDALPRTLMLRLRKAVESQEVKHVVPTRSLAAFVSSSDDQVLPGDIYIHVKDLTEWLIRSGYATESSIQRMPALRRYEENERAKQREIANFLKALRVVSATEDDLPFPPEQVASFMKLLDKDNQLSWIGQMVESYSRFGLKRGNSEEDAKLLREDSKQILLKMIAALSAMQPIDIWSIHSSSEIKLATDNMGHPVGGDTVTKYVSEAREYCPRPIETKKTDRR